MKATYGLLLPVKLIPTHFVVRLATTGGGYLIGDACTVPSGADAGKIIVKLSTGEESPPLGPQQVREGAYQTFMQRKGV